MIEKAGLDGSNRQKLVEEGIGWPNSITIDFPQDRIYWTDGKLDIIASADLEGSNRRTVGKFLTTQHPFALDVFEDTIYWSDWSSRSVIGGSKFNLDNKTFSLEGLKSPMVVRVFHALKQPRAANRCGENNGDCLHMCLPSPKWPGFSCHCADNVPVENKTTCTMPS